MSWNERLQELAFKIEHLGVLRNPDAYFDVVFFGRRRTLHFVDGLEFPCDRQNRRCVQTLIGLARLGAPLALAGRETKMEWAVDPIHNIITVPPGIRLSLNQADSTVLAETFLYEIHFQDCDLKNQLVFDVGANVGDTALYFASKGAQVHAYEPDPENFAVLQQNLSMNPELSSHVTPTQAAVGEDGSMVLHIGARSGSGLFAKGPAADVASYSLKSILQRAGTRDAFLLKADCKGCETSLVRQNEIQKFSRIAIEYTREHGLGDPLNIAAALESAGFKSIRLFKTDYAFRSLADHGMIRARRNHLEQ